MSCDLSKLNEADRKDFEERLAVYGLDAASVHDDDLVVSRESTLVLSMGPDSYVKPRILQTKDLDVVKRWVGVDDRVLEQAEHESYTCLPPPPRSSQVAQAQPAQETPGSVRVSGRKTTAAARKAYDTSKLAASDLDNLKLAARTYVRGHSKMVPAGYKSLIEDHFGVIQIAIWAYLKITVKSGSVLQFGPGSNVLAAYELEIEPGGVVRSYGHLTVNCTIVRRPSVLAVLAPQLGAQVAARI